MVGLTASDAQKATYHHGLEGVVYNDLLGGLPDTVNSLFQGSGKCAGCHAEDPNELASIAGQTFPMEPMPDGWDVNVVDDWRSSLMANSTKDPFWRAKVRHEVITNPGHAPDSRTSAPVATRRWAISPPTTMVQNTIRCWNP